MAEKVTANHKRGRDERRGGGNRRATIRRRWLMLGAVAVLAAAATTATLVWREHLVARPAQALLPARPETAGRPAILGELLAKAEAQARSATTRFDGIEALGRLYHANGFNAEAEACWRLLRAQQPHEARWSYYLADLRRAEGDEAEMAGLLRATLELAPDYAPAHLRLANLQLKIGDFDGAERGYRHRLVLWPSDPYARLGVVRIALQRERTDEARTLLEKILQDAPNFSTAHNLYAEILAAAGDQARAKWHRWLGVETIRYTEPEDPWLDELTSWCYDYDRLCVLGSIEAQRENHEQAKALYERAIQLEPGALEAYQLLSVVYFNQDQPAQARDLLEQARPRLTTGDRTAWFTYLSRAYRMLKQPAEAERVVRKGLEERGRTAELLEAWGLALADLERHAEAVDAYEAALVTNPNDASTNYNLAVSLLALGRLDDTLAALDRSLTLQPTFPATLLLRGRIEMAAGHWERAEEQLRPVFESDPANPEARRLLAEWHRHRGAHAETINAPVLAEQHYRDGLTIDPNDSELQVSLGVFYLVRARFADAIAPLEAYHRLQPESAQGCLFLGQAYAAVGREEDARGVLNRGAELARRAGNSRAENFCRELLRQIERKTP